MKLFEKLNTAKFHTNMNEAVFPVSFHDVMWNSL